MVESNKMKLLFTNLDRIYVFMYLFFRYYYYYYYYYYGCCCSMASDWMFSSNICCSGGMVSTRLLTHQEPFKGFYQYRERQFFGVQWSISMDSNLFSRALGVSRAPVTTRTTFTFIFHTFFSSLDRSRYLSIFLTSLSCSTLSFSTFLS